MARSSKAKSTVDTNTATVDSSTVAGEFETVDEMNVNAEKTATKAKKNVDPLEDSDEIEVVSLVPNVSYKDSRTNDIFEWERVGHVEYMTVETLKNMWRNHKGYFRNMLLKPNDDRVVAKFGLKNVYDKYEFLMDKSNYTRKNISLICETISSTPNGLKFSICSKVKNLVASGDVSDIMVIKALEKHLNLDLTSFLD